MVYKVLCKHPPQTHHFSCYAHPRRCFLSALTLIFWSQTQHRRRGQAFFFFGPQWISHDFLQRDAVKSSANTLLQVVKTSARPRHGNILASCELMQRRFPWGWQLGSELSSSGQTSFKSTEFKNALQTVCGLAEGTVTKRLNWFSPLSTCKDWWHESKSKVKPVLALSSMDPTLFLLNDIS